MSHHLLLTDELISPCGRSPCRVLIGKVALAWLWVCWRHPLLPLTSLTGQDGNTGIKSLTPAYLPVSHFLSLSMSPSPLGTFSNCPLFGTLVRSVATSFRAIFLTFQVLLHPLDMTARSQLWLVMYDSEDIFLVYIVLLILSVYFNLYAHGTLISLAHYWDILPVLWLTM